MGAILTAFASQPQQTQIVTLGGVQFQARLTYRNRTRAWYLDLYTSEGTALALGRRLSAGWGPLVGLSIPDGPAGYLFVRGADPYNREALGEDLRLIFYTAAEVEALAEEEEGPVVVVTES
jgi:hypothetical protein